MHESTLRPWSVDRTSPVPGTRWFRGEPDTTTRRPTACIGDRFTGRRRTRATRLPPSPFAAPLPLGLCSTPRRRRRRGRSRWVGGRESRLHVGDPNGDVATRGAAAPTGTRPKRRSDEPGTTRLGPAPVRPPSAGDDKPVEVLFRRARRPTDRPSHRPLATWLLVEDAEQTRRPAARLYLASLSRKTQTRRGRTDAVRAARTRFRAYSAWSSDGGTVTVRLASEETRGPERSGPACRSEGDLVRGS